MYRVELFHWVNGSGFSCNETFDHLDEYCTAEEYVKSLDTSAEELIRDDATKVAIFDKDDNELSSYWINKED